MLDNKVLRPSWRLLQLEPKASPFPLCNDGGGGGGFRSNGGGGGGLPLCGAGDAAATLLLPRLSQLFLQWC